MRAHIKVYLWLALVTVWGCTPKVDPQSALPDYFSVPSSLSGYQGSGEFVLTGGISVNAIGAEHLDPATKTYMGVQGTISKTGSLNVGFTAGQPLDYKDRDQVPTQYQANGALAIIGPLAVGNYPLGINEARGPKGEFADLTMNLPGPQIYFAQTGQLTVAEVTVIKTQGTDTLYRVRGTFQTRMFGSGVGISASKPVDTMGTFDLLLVSN